MAIEATYIVLEHLKKKIEDMIAPDTFNFYPGKWADDSEDFSVGVYRVDQNADYTQPYINVDAITLTLFHPKFDSLQKIISVINKELNNENIQDNPELYAAGLSENIRFQDVVCRAGQNTNNQFIEGTEYFVGNADILIQYVELA